MKNKNNFNIKEFFLGSVFTVAGFFMLGIFLLESKVIVAINERSSETMVDLIAIKTIVLAVLAIVTAVYVYLLKKQK